MPVHKELVAMAVHLMERDTENVKVLNLMLRSRHGHSQVVFEAMPSLLHTTTAL